MLLPLTEGVGGERGKVLGRLGTGDEVKKRQVQRLHDLMTVDRQPSSARLDPVTEQGRNQRGC